MQESENNIDLDAVLNSMAGAGRAQPPAGLFYKIEQRLQQKFPAVRIIPIRTVSLAAASILLLIVMNIIVAASAKTNERQSRDSMQGLVEYYGLTDNYGI